MTVLPVGCWFSFGGNIVLPPGIVAMTVLPVGCWRWNRQKAEALLGMSVRSPYRQKKRLSIALSP